MRIAVYGKMRAGKTAVCDFIKDKFKNVEVLDFGDSLKECMAIAFPETIGKPKNRAKLIEFGQHMRKLDEDVWVNTVKYKLKNTTSEIVLVTGVRQENEYNMLKEQGFVFIQVDASENTRIERCKANNDIFTTDNLRSHTEVVMDDFEPDYVILNERGFKDLEIQANNVLGEILLNHLGIEKEDK